MTRPATSPLADEQRTPSPGFNPAPVARAFDPYFITNRAGNIGRIHLKKEMNMPTTITLAGRELPIQELNFAQLKRLLPAINRTARAMAIGNLDEAAMEDMGTVLSVGTGMPPAELDALPIKGCELAAAFQAIVDLAGLGQKQEAAKPGEVEAVATGIGTTFPPISPPASAGPGEH